MYIVTVIHVMVAFLFKIEPAFCNDTNRIKPGSNTKMTDKHVAGKYSKITCLDIK